VANMRQRRGAYRDVVVGGSSLFTSLSMLLILKLLKYLKSIIFHRGYVAA